MYLTQIRVQQQLPYFRTLLLCLLKKPLLGLQQQVYMLIILQRLKCVCSTFAGVQLRVL